MPGPWPWPWRFIDKRHEERQASPRLGRKSKPLRKIVRDGLELSRLVDAGQVARGATAIIGGAKKAFEIGRRIVPCFRAEASRVKIGITVR